MRKIAFLDGLPGHLGTDIVTLGHMMAETDLFSDRALANLIESYPRDQVLVSLLGPQGAVISGWCRTDLAGLNGRSVLQAIRAGCYCIKLEHLERHAPIYGALVTAGFDEIERATPRLRVLQRESSLLISPPGASFACHADVPLVCRWQMRGEKQMWFYPADRLHNWSQRRREAMIMSGVEARVGHEAAWDSAATRYTLRAGRAVCWPINAPHRATNGSGLNVSISSKFFTPETLRMRDIHLANAYLRRWFGIAPAAPSADGAGNAAKRLMAKGLAAMGVHRPRARRLGAPQRSIALASAPHETGTPTCGRATDRSQPASLPHVCAVTACAVRH